LSHPLGPERYTSVDALMPVADATADFETLFATHYEGVTRAVARVLHDQSRAEEIAADAFARMFQHAASSGPYAGAWLRQTAIRLALDELRRRARWSRYQKALRWVGVAPPPDQLFAAEQEQGRVRAVLASIPSRDSELLLMRYDGSSYEDLARLLGVQPTSIGTLLRRAQHAFRKEYVKRYGEP
jgi:RNA polymerase sigma-70 factor, ECF subfamily